jgi:peptidoglycan/LPS O-acetylase OafA/YrhL
LLRTGKTAEHAGAEAHAAIRRQHIAALDGLRGFGALVVVARHTLNAIAMPESSRRAVLEGPLAFVLNGNAMVQMFFVLSGSPRSS